MHAKFLKMLFSIVQEVAQEFCLKHDLSEEVTLPLAKHLEDNLKHANFQVRIQTSRMS